MTERITENDPPAGIFKVPLVASLISLIGLADSAYLTIKHYAGEPVPCSLVEGCEKVLSSPYAEIAGIPIAAAGAAAYFVAFSFAVLAAFGNRSAWNLFGLVSIGMAGFSAWLIYLQAFVIEAFCQFCLLSAGTSLLLFVCFIGSKLISNRSGSAETKD